MVKVLLSSRHGGHATRTPLVKQKIEAEIEAEEYIVVTDYKDDYSYEEKVYRVPSFRPTRGKFYHPLKAFKNFLKSFNILRNEDPDLVVVYGANTSFPMGMISCLSSRKVICVESENRTKEPSLTPKVLNRFGAEVWVSHDSLLDKYPTENVVNKDIIGLREYSDHESEEIENDTLVIPSSRDQELMKQWDYIPNEELLEKMAKTRLVVTRAGMAAYEAAHLAEKVIVKPYDHIHQENFAEWIEEEFDNVEVEMEKSFRELFEKYKEEF